MKLTTNTILCVMIPVLLLLFASCKKSGGDDALLLLFLLGGSPSGSGSGSGAIAETIPPTPVGVIAAAGDSQNTVSWSAASGATSYIVYWNTTGTVTTGDTQIASATFPYVHTGLTNGTTYYYAIVAVNTKGSSGLSAEVNVTPTAFVP